MTAFSQTLFKHHTNGTIGSWTIEVVENPDGSVNLNSIAHKVLDGKPVITPRVITEGKNLGKANETTCLEQAISEAKAKAEKKVKGGYVKDIADAQERATNGMGFIKPMLAQPIEKVKNWSYPVYLQTKFDGHRCLAAVDDNNAVILYSRDGNPIHLPHIQALLQDAYDSGIWAGGVLDGELYKHGETLNRISSLIKKAKEGTESLVYQLYDIYEPEVCYTERLSIIRQIDEFLESESVAATETVVAETEGELTAFHANAIAEGFEGTIVRQMGVGYEDGKRSKSLMKKKDFDDTEFEIIGYRLGTPKVSGSETLQQPVLKLITNDGVTFDCNAPGNTKERHQLYVNGLVNLIGRAMTVKHFGYTEFKTPFLPTPLRLREDL